MVTSFLSKTALFIAARDLATVGSAPQSRAVTTRVVFQSSHVRYGLSSKSDGKFRISGWVETTLSWIRRCWPTVELFTNPMFEPQCALYSESKE
jgi:hypothetical protein